MFGFITLITVCSAVLGSGPCETTEQVVLTPADLEAGDRLGASVDIFGNAVLAGAAFDDNKSGNDAGSAYLIRLGPHGQWVEEDKLFADDGSNGDAFGSAVALCGPLAVVGAPFDDNPNLSGSAYVFRPSRTGRWTQEQKLMASDAESNDRFGSSVAAILDLVAVGAPLDDHGQDNAGSVYVFEFSRACKSWVEVAKLVSAQPNALDNFGFSVSLAGDLIVVGAIGDDDGAVDAGAAYVYRRSPDRSTWQFEQKLTAEDATQEGFFGTSVDVHETTIVVGAVGEGEAGDLSGAAYLLRCKARPMD